MLKTGETLEPLYQRLRRLGWVVAVFFLIVATGYWYLQVIRAEHYRQLSENNRLRRQKIIAARGVILDRRGRPLVENTPSYHLLVDRSQATDLDASLQFASEVLGQPRAELEKVMERYRGVPQFAATLLAEDLSLSQVARFEVSALERPEFQIEVRQRRLYRHGPQTAHLLGYLAEAGPDDVAGGLAVGTWVGRDGIEQVYDELLRGRDGEREIVVDSRGKLIDEYRHQAADAGQRLVLTLDLDLQQAAQQLLGESVGAVVAIDPRDGAVRALVSSPAYDPNRFARRLARDEWYNLLASPHHALQNRTVHNTYSPGSVFKLVLAVAALSEDVFGPDRKVWCSGTVSLHDRPRRCWRRQGHGWVNLHEAIKNSCDIYFYQLGQELGIDRIARYARRLGLGSRTGIDLVGERSGLVPDSAWSLKERGSPWYPGETVSVAIGQGPLLATPLQIAVLTAALANGGFLVVPHLRQGGAQEPADLGLDESALAAVREAMRAVVNDAGSGASARVEGFEIAGKTGTAQVVEQRTWTRSSDLPYEHRDHAWFASYGPTDRPRLVVVVFVEHGGLGSQTAAPIAKGIYEAFLRLDDEPGASTPHDS